MIGGATTSKAHTAVKIDQNFSNDQVIYVPDASRSVAVATQLISDELKTDFVTKTAEDYEKVRVRYANRKPKAAQLSYDKAIANKPAINWDGYKPPVPKQMATQVLTQYSIPTLVEMIDWTPFFITWDLAGKYPRILTDEVVGEAATNLFSDAQAMLKRIVDEDLLEARAVFGFWPANQVNDDDILLYKDDSRSEELATLHHIRQQVAKPSGKPNLSLADFVAPKETGIADYVGGFVVTAGINAEKLAKEFEAKGDDYNSIMIKALADRLAEAFAEHLHQRVRTEYWGYIDNESLSNEEIIKERYQGIRPAPGYPACPDHTEKATLFALLDAEQAIGVELTEHYAMTPAASVSGFYYSHPESQYFATGKIGNDQLESISKRKDKSLEEMTRWLQPILE